MTGKWSNNTNYNVGDWVKPTVGNGFVYVAVTGGTSGSSEPSWPTTVGQSVNDNTVQWVCINGRIAVGIEDLIFDHIKQNGNVITVCTDNPIDYYEACDPPEWQASTEYTVGDVVRPSIRNNYVYKCITSGTSGTDEPVFPENPGDTVVDGTVTWECVENLSLCSVTALPDDYSIFFSTTGARTIQTGEYDEVPVFRTGLGTHLAILDSVNKQLLAVTPVQPFAYTAGGFAIIRNAKFSLRNT